MALGVIDSGLLTDIAAAVRGVKNSSSKYTASQMAEELNSYIDEREAALAEQKELIEELESEIKKVQGSDSIFANSIVDRSITSLSADDLTSTTEIGDYAFYGCTDLQEAEFSDNISRIGDYAFYGATLWNVEFPDGLTEIGESAFANNASLQSVKFGRTSNSDTLSIGDGAFRDSTDLMRIDFRLLTSVPEVETDSQVFNSGLNNYQVWINKDLDWTFQTSALGTQLPNAEWITWNVVPQGQTTISRFEYEGYVGCYISNTVTLIDSYAFSGDSMLLEVEFEKNSSLTEIGNYAFSNCSYLTSISIPGSVTTIGDRAFEECTNLGEISFLEHTSVPSIGADAFFGASQISIMVPYALYEEWKAAPNWSDYANYIMAT